MAEAFRGECLSLAAQLEQYAKIDGMLPGVVAAMQESAAVLRRAAKPDEDPDAMNERRAAEDTTLASNVREATIEECAKLVEEMDFPAPRKNHRYQHDVKYGIVAAIRALSTTGKPKP